MKGLKDTSVQSKLRILTALFVGAMVLFGLLAYRTLQRVKIGGLAYQRIADNNAEVTDFAIPTQFALVGRVLAYQMRADVADKEKLSKEVNQLRVSLKAFEDGHSHWMSIEDDPAIKGLLVKVYDSGHQYLTLESDTYAPLLMDGNTAGADAFRIEKMNPRFADHQKALDQFLDAVQTHLTEQEAKVRSEASIGVLILIAVGLGASALVAALTFYLGNGIVGPLHRTVEVLNEVSKGNLTSRLVVIGSDEIAQMGNALNETIENLSRALTQISSDSKVLYQASDDSSKVSKDLITNSQQTTSQAAAVSSAAEQVSQNVQTVSTAAEEMTASIKEISKNASEAAEVASSAARLASATNATMTKLSESSAEIGNVIKVITSIAEQTNLLALNATIEAARAGEAGKGFAVVANEVKELAKETAKATEDIGAKVEAIQHDAKGAVQAIDEITTVIGRINDIQNTIASAVEEQTGTTNEISRNVSETAKGSSDIASNITGVASSAKATHDCAAIAENSAAALARVAASLTGVVGQFQLSNQGRLGNVAGTSH